ncbi:MAG TPA: hypothetical protein VHW44_24925 [Pseudonocardiaceae bacterium]|nr:hypothetical protein [Pseudonocardiaceae bacterium]
MRTQRERASWPLERPVTTRVALVTGSEFTPLSAAGAAGRET